MAKIPLARRKRVTMSTRETFCACVIALAKQQETDLKDPSQPPPFPMPSKLLILHGEAKSYSFTVSCVPENMFHYL